MFILGIDIGGTSIKAGVITSEGELKSLTSRPTPKTSYEALCQSLDALVEWAKNEYDLSGVAISQPCATDALTGACQSEGALGYILDQNIQADLANRHALRGSAENDGNCAALAEVWLGGAVDVKDMVLVVCGTGVGGAIVKDRLVHSGHRRYAGELGMCIHQYDADSGEYITWSHTGSTVALIKDYAKRAGLSYDDLDGKQVFARAQEGCQHASAAIKAFYFHLAVGVHNIQHVYDPELIMLGGAISVRSDFIQNIENALDQIYSTFDYKHSRPRLATSHLGPEANILGAVYHWLQQA